MASTISNQILDLKSLLELLHSNSHIDVQINLFSTLSAYLISKDANIDVIIRYNSLYDKIYHTLTNCPPRKAIVLFNFLSTLIYAIDENDSRRKMLTTYAKNMIRSSGCLAVMCEFFTGCMMKMPRNYVRKRPDRKIVTEEQMTRAKVLIAEGMSQRRAAEEVGISEGGLRKRLLNNNVPISLGRFRPTFNEVQELEFAMHCKKMDEMFYGLTINDLRRLAYEFAVANNIKNRFNESTKMAGRDWVECFLRRHPNLCMRQSAPTSLARAIGFNRAQVDRFYKNLKEVYNKYKFPPNRIYNMDETGISTVPKKTPKVISVRGKKVVGKLVSAERGTTVTAVLSMNVTGNFIPPAFIYPRKRPRSELLDGCPLQSIIMVSDSGFINSDLFVNWLQHFKHFSHPSHEEPVLLILDNHSSHISLEATSYARANHIVMVTLPPHGSHKLQPLDVAVHSPLKTKYAIECEKWMTQHPGRGITQFQVASLFNAAFKQVATMSNAESGFRATGIFPFADDIFDDTDFAPASVTDLFSQPNEPVENNSNQPSTENVPEIDERNVSPSLLDNDNIQIENISINEIDITVSTTNTNSDTINSCIPIVYAITEDQTDIFKLHKPVSMMEGIATESDMSLSKQSIETDNQRDELFSKETEATESQISSNKENIKPAKHGDKSITEKTNTAMSNISSNNKNVQLDNQRVKLVDLSPLPKMREKKKISRVSLKSEIVTASPFKNQLEEKRKNEEENKARKRLKPIDLGSEPGPSGINRKSTKHKKNCNRIGICAQKLSLKNKHKISKKEVICCPICQEKYEDPPTEDWIQCSVCEKWFHEECTAYVRGAFTCDFCDVITK